MSVFGIDFGSLNSTVAITRQGGVDIITNEVSKRETTTMVTFVNEERFIGEQALDRYVRNSKNTAFLLKRLIGVRMSDPQLEYERKWITCSLKGDENNRLMMGVEYCGKLTYFYPEQILAMVFQKLRSYVSEAATADKKNPVKPRDCVITTPFFYTLEQRQLVYQAAEAAGLHCMMLECESAAVAVDYGAFRGGSLKEKMEEAQLVGILDIGYAATTFAIYKFWRGNCAMIAQSFDRNCGTRDVDYQLFLEMKSLVKDKYKVDVGTNQRASLRILEACERVKYLLSANQAVPLNVENVMDIDINIPSFERSRLEAISTHVLEKVRAVLLSGLKMAGVEGSNLHSLEMIGGGCRIPMFKSLVESILGEGRAPSFTLNASEAIVRGAAVLAASLSPLFRVREFKVTQLCPYPIQLGYFSPTASHHEVAPFLPDVNKVISLLSTSDSFPKVIDVTIPNCIKSVKLYAFYDYTNEQVKKEIQPHSFVIGEWEMGIPGASNEPHDVVVRLQVSPDGFIAVDSATALRVEKEAPEAPAEEKPNEEHPPSTNTGDEGKPDAAEKPRPSKTKKAKYLRCNVKPGLGLLGHSATKLEAFKKEEDIMHGRDMKIIFTRDKRNELESYILNYGPRFAEGGMLYEYATKEDKSRFLNLAEEYENWLYGEGDNATLEEYDSRTQTLKAIGEAAQKRYLVRDEINFAVKGFATELERMKNHALKNGENGAVAETVEKAVTALDQALTWAEQETANLLALPKTQDGTFNAQSLKQKMEEVRPLVNACNSRPPKPAAPPAPAETPATEGAAEGGEAAPAPEPTNTADMGNEVPPAEEGKKDESSTPAK